MSKFVVDPRLVAGSHFICDLDLCRLVLNDNVLFPWVILVPKRDNLREIIDLPEKDRIILMREISSVSQIMKDIFKPDKLNVAALGNIVPQLHIHIIGRYQDDAAWPSAPFGGKKAEYKEDRCIELIGQMQEAIEKYND